MPKQKNGQIDMNKWKKVKLGKQLKRIRTGKLDANASSENGIYPFFTCSVFPLKIGTYSYDCECVLVAGNGDLNVKYYNGKFDAYQRTYILEILDKNILNTRYFYYFMKDYIDILRTKTKGGVIKYIRLNDIADAEIPLPAMEEQKKIAARLDAVSDLLAKQKQLLSEQDNLIQSTFYDMFGDPIKNEKGFPYLQIKDLVSDVQYGTSQKADYTGKMPILRMNNITYSGEMDYTDLKYIDLEEETNKYILKKGDVLFNRTNSRELVGKTGLFNLDKLMVYAGYLIRVRLKEICLPIFLTKYMNTPQLKAFLKEKCKGIVGQANINAKEFQAIPIFLPPFELQQKFAAIAEQIESEKSKIKSAIAETQTLFNALMSEYFEE